MNLKIKQMMIVIMAFMIPFLAMAEQNPIGKVFGVSGEVYMTTIKNGVKVKLVKGDLVYLGSIIQTGKKSSVFIEMEDHMIKMIPEDTKMMFFDEESWKLYQKTDKSIHKIFSVIGKKADSKEEQKLKEKMSLKLKEEFENQDYVQVVKIIESGKITLTKPDILFIAALSYLKIGHEKKSLTYFQKLLDTGSFEYRMYSQYGLFINYIRLKQMEKAKKIFLEFEEENRIYEEMKKVLEEAKVNENQ